MALERMTKDIQDEREWAIHRYRYELASKFTKDSDIVVDAACGIGYGKSILKGKWIGIDKNPPEEGLKVDLNTWIPYFEYDVFVCLETLEHLSDYRACITAAKRAKKFIIVSCPIIPTKHFNEFHLHDFTGKQLIELFEEKEWKLEHSEIQDNIYGIYVFRRQPLVTVIVPTYKRNDLLFNRCLPSICNQEYKNIEVIVISDGPNEERYHIVPQNVIYIELPKNHGCYGGHCKLVGSYFANGEITAYLDDDDEYTTDHISSLVKLLQDTDSDFVFSKMHGATKEGVIVTVGDGEPAFMKIGTPMILHKTELFKINNWHPSLSYSDDWELVDGWLRAGCKYAFLDKITIHLRGEKPKMKISVIIPTYNHLEDNLKPCIQSILKYTKMDEVEIIVVANGCTDGTHEYLDTLPVKSVIFPEPLGYPKAINEGIKASSGEYIVLLNNDTQLLEQSVNCWLDLLLAPFSNPNAGISGPVKFTWNCGETIRTCMAFWMVMIPRVMFSNIGMLDEEFSPGMGEDADFCCKLEEHGFAQVQVPEDISHEFGQPGPASLFPVYHIGNGTFGDNHQVKDEVVTRNTQKLIEKYGNELERIYRWCFNHKCDINEHFPTLLKYASECSHVTEFGVRDVFSTMAFLSARPNKVISYDIYYSPQIDGTIELAKKLGLDFSFKHQDTISAEIEPTELLFIDTKHTYKQLKSELEAHSGKVLKYIIMHDTVSFGHKGEEWEDNNEDIGLVPAINEFLEKHHEWQVAEIFENNNGLTILKRKTPKYSIVIPTFNRCDELLKPCIESIIQYTNMDNVEVVVVANGCTDNTEEYLKTLPYNIVILTYKDALGYTKATNHGIRRSTGEYVVLLNNDCILLPQGKDEWLTKMQAPFSDESVAVTGPLSLFDEYARREVLIFFCVMIKKTVFDTVGLLDEIYSPGGGEDIDFCAKAEDLGMKCVRIPMQTTQSFDSEKFINIGDFPIYHKGEGTFDHIPEYGRYIIKNNGLINCKKYNKHIRLDLGCGPAKQPGYLGVDNKDPKADIIMNVCKLEFDDNSVEEIIASHLLEHLNPYHVLDTLKEWNRVLKPGGKLIMEMPDIIKLCEEIVKGDKVMRYSLLNCVYGAVNTSGEGDQSNITSPHLWGWDFPMVADHLWGAGFVDIQYSPEKIPHPGFNFRVTCSKPIH